MAYDALPAEPPEATGVNYGFDRLRFLTPVRAGARVRGRFRIEAREARAPGQTLTRIGVAVEIEGAERPALVADWLTLSLSPEAHSGK